MPVLPKQPLIYEINTWVWLDELSRKHKPRHAVQRPARGMGCHRILRV